MRKLHISLLAAAAFGIFVVPAAAQVPAGVPAMPWGNPAAWARADLMCEAAGVSSKPDGQEIRSAPALWLDFTWAVGGGGWVECVDGPIARAWQPRRLHAPGSCDGIKDRRVAAAVPMDTARSAVEICRVCWIDPFHPNEPIGSQAANNAPSAGSLFDFREHALFPMENNQGLTLADAELTAADCCDVPACALPWNGDGRPGVQLSVGASVCFIAGLGSNGLSGHHLSQYQGVGSSVWLGCNTPVNGLEMRVGLSSFGFSNR